jgi:hypothetical protein
VPTGMILRQYVKSISISAVPGKEQATKKVK